MKTVWNKQNTTYFPSEPSVQVKDIPVGVYKVGFHELAGPYVSLLNDKFEFPYKIYGVEKDFIRRVVKTWKNTNGNLGILLNGLKGTGKTVTAELICNAMNLPVLLITSPHPAYISFLAELKQEVIVFIDEFEKVYREKDEPLLSLMDGVLNGTHRKMFMLTTNSLTIDRNLLQRPSRIRYVKTFDDLTLPVIMEVVNDQLVHKHLYDQTVAFISNLPIITMDLIKAVIAEVNIHEEDPDVFRNIFNVHGEIDDLYNVYELKDDGTAETVAKLVKVSPNWFYRQDQVGYGFNVGRQYMGEIVEVINDNTVKVQITIEDPEEDDDDEDTGFNLAWEKDGSPSITEKKKRKKERVFKVFRFEKAYETHKAFKNYGSPYAV